MVTLSLVVDPDGPEGESASRAALWLSQLHLAPTLDVAFPTQYV